MNALLPPPPHPLREIRDAAAKWRRNHPDQPHRGRVMVSINRTTGMAFAFGWTIDQPIPGHFTPGIYAVSAEGEVSVAAGGTASEAERWELLHEDVIRPAEPAPFLFPTSHPPLASRRFQTSLTSAKS